MTKRDTACFDRRSWTHRPHLDWWLRSLKKNVITCSFYFVFNEMLICTYLRSLDMLQSDFSDFVLQIYPVKVFTPKTTVSFFFLFTSNCYVLSWQHSVEIISIPLKSFCVIRIFRNSPLSFLLVPTRYKYRSSLKHKARFLLNILLVNHFMHYYVVCASVCVGWWAQHGLS